MGGSKRTFMQIREDKSYETILKACEFQVKWNKKPSTRPQEKITNSKQIVDMFRMLWSGNMEINEEFYVIVVNNSNKMVGWYMLSKGGITNTVVDIPILINLCLQSLGKGIIMAHNHPSGNLRPSDSDKALCNKVKEACKIFDIQVLDNLILTADDYYSFADEGLL